MTFQSSHRRTRTTHATRSTETAKHGMLAFEIHRVGVVVPGVVVVDDDDTVTVSKSVSSGFRNDTSRDDDGWWWCVALVAVASTGESETATAPRRGGVDVQV